MGYDTAYLIRHFITAAAEVQRLDDILIVGIVTLQVLAKKYEMETQLKHAKSYGYICSTDADFIQKCIQHGYRHARTGDESECDHETYAKHHKTYVFKRMFVVQFLHYEG